MDRSLGPLSVIGARTSAALEVYSDAREQAIETARRRVLEASRRSPERASRKAPHLALAAAFAVAVVALTVLSLRLSPLEFTADGRSVDLDNWVAAPVDRSVALDFSDGSAFVMQGSSRARVVAVERHGATIALENGSLDARVVHRPGSAWNVIAGPLTVKVTGTHFRVTWSALEGELTVAVKEGSVTVGGAFIGAAQSVGAGESLRVVVSERRVERGPRASTMLERGDSARPAPAEDSARALVPSPAPSEKPVDSRERAPEKATSEGEQAPSTPEWRELIRSGSLRSAFSAAEARGFDKVCREATAAELLALGDAARLSGRPERANQALRLLRSRYPADPRRAAAAFALGKVAFDEARDYRQAAEWFSISVREQPGGSLSREARGRLLEALQRAGDSANAERAARDYLERHPSGPHAALARSILR